MDVSFKAKRHMSQIPQSPALLSIGETARRSGSSPRALRYYEEQGLLAPERTEGGQRRYPADAVERVLLYRRLIDAGLGTEVIRELLPCMNGSATSDTVATLQREHKKLLAQAKELEATAGRLESLLESL
ncbi:MAG TPA: MerR family transcriptional regulator [Brevibacterium linens]|nr:MerR family transcriptional regulator [Brevibacterium linens]